MMDSDFVGFLVGYRLYWVMMHWTLQKFISNLYFVQKNIISIALIVFYTCTTIGKKLKKFSNYVRSNSYFWLQWAFYLITVWYKPKLPCHSKIGQSTNHRYGPEVHFAIKYWNLRIFKIFNWSGIIVDNINFISWIQIQKI